MKRFIWIDWLRTTSIFLVLLIHSTEPFYLGGDGSLIETESDAFWVAFFDSFARACVPLFVIASSFLQFPLKHSTGDFFRKRAVRVLIPFVIWTIVYALVWGEPVQNFNDLLLNFSYAAGHLWFVYMLVGLYLLIPMLSPWAERVSRRCLLFYLSICLFTTIIPFIRESSADDMLMVYGSSGIPNFAKFPLWGECSWNAYGLFYYVSGFIGYMLFGLYVRRFVGELSWSRTVALSAIPWLAGFAISFFGFLSRVNASAHGAFPVEGSVAMAVGWETPLLYDSLGVALMAVGWVFLYKKISNSGRFYSSLTLPLSRASYGVYLCHMLILVPVSAWLRECFGIGANSSLGIWSTPVEICLTAVITFSLASLACIAVGRIPRLGKFIVG